MFEKLNEELKKLPKNFVVGIITKSADYKDVNLHIIDFLMNKKNCAGSYITVNRPYVNVVEIMKERKLDTTRIHFIDCITRTLGGQVPSAINCEFVSSPSHLTELSIALHNYVMRSTDKNRFLHIDSLSTLCVHNDISSILKFVHYVTGKMRLFGLNGVMISLSEETDKKLISELGMFCDKMIHI